MEGIKAVKIVRFIDHIINHETRQLEPSQLDTPIGPESKFPHELFAGYILKALQSDGRRHSRFREPPGKVISAVRSLRHGGDFVQISTDIAQHLYTTMNTSAYSASINPGDLMVALFSDGDDTSLQPAEYLALLKLDPSNDVIREVKIEDGKRRVVFVRKSTRIPEPGEKGIQKIALIDGERREDRPYDAVLLDKEIRRKAVAKFFHDAFLESDLVRSASDGPRLLLKPLKDFLADQANIVDPPLQPGEKLEILANARRIVTTQTEVPFSEFLDKSLTLPARPGRPARPPEHTRTIRAGAIAAFDTPLPPEERIKPTDTVAIHAGAAARLTSRVTYVLDKGVKIEGDQQAMDDLLEIDENLDKQGRTKITIRTKTFRLA